MRPKYVKETASGVGGFGDDRLSTFRIGDVDIWKKEVAYEQKIGQGCRCGWQKGIGSG